MEKLRTTLSTWSKSLLIFALAALAVFQVSQLWFVNITDRNFFLYLQARFAPVAPDGLEDFTRPFRVVYGAGDGHFHIRHSEIRDLGAWGYSTRAITEILTHGQFVAQQPAAEVQIMSRPVFLYEYAFAMSPDIFAQAFGHRVATALSGGDVDSFYKIAVLPPGDDDSAKVFFINHEYAWEFSLERDNRASLAITIDDVPQDALHFVPDEGDSFAFLPIIPAGFVYHPLNVVNPYKDALGALRLVFIRGRIATFFNNPATINESPGVDGTYTFSNLNTIVRYHTGDVLEYSSFRPIGSTASINLVGDFSAALAFVDSDQFVINEVFLADYEPRGRGHLFRFNYVISDFPVVLNQEWPTGVNCRDPLLAPIEVEVDHGRVIRYRRLAYNFHMNEDYVSFAHHLSGQGDIGFIIDYDPADDFRLRLELLGE